jgi:hypothetical protein
MKVPVFDWLLLLVFFTYWIAFGVIFLAAGFLAQTINTSRKQNLALWTFIVINWGFPKIQQIDCDGYHRPIVIF